MIDPVEGSLERLLPSGPGKDLRRQVLQAVETELQESRGRRWELILAVAALVLPFVGGGLIRHANVRHERQMAQLLGPRPMPKAIIELQATIASVTNEATGARWAEHQRTVQGNLATKVPTTVCSVTREGLASDFLLKGPYDEILEEDGEMDGTGRPAPRGDTSYRPFGSPIPLRQTA